MSITDKRKNVNGVSLCTDPSREDCFTIAQHDAEMTQILEFAGDGVAAAAGRRERLHRHMNNEVGAALATAHLLELGHRRIAHIQGEEAFVCTGQRLSGL